MAAHLRGCSGGKDNTSYIGKPILVCRESCLAMRIGRYSSFAGLLVHWQGFIATLRLWLDPTLLDNGYFPDK